MFKALLMAALFLFGISPDAHAQAGWQFTTIDVPGASTDCYGIRPDGRLTGGGYIGSDGQTHGWLRNRRGEFSWFDYPDANFTKVQGINSHGEFTGNYRLRGAPMGTRHGYLWNYGELITFDPPGSVFKEPYKINERGGIAGRYFTVLACGPGHDESHGFVRPRDGEFTLIDFPDGTYTWAYKISESGQVLGSYTDLDGLHHMYLLNDGVFTTFDYPNAYWTPSSLGNAGMNSRGDIVSNYCDRPPCAGTSRGFLRSRWGEFFGIDIPDASFTFPTDITRRGNIIIGSYALAPEGPDHCFVLRRGERDEDNDDCDGDCGDGDVPRTGMPARLP